jgi:hypothetical protein
MLVSHKRRFVFIHVPKTGGISVATALKPYCDDDAMRAIKQHGLTKHSGIRQIARVFGWEMLDEYFTFAFERNPWDKCVSLYWYQMERWDRFRKPWRKENPSFEEWFSPFGFWPKKLHSSFRRYSVGGKVSVDFLGKYENLSEDFKYVCRQIGIPEVALPHRNPSTLRPRKKDYRPYYTERMRKRVERTFRREIAMLEYQF